MHRFELAGTRVARIFAGISERPQPPASDPPSTWWPGER
jgi:hypothetical protein